MDVSLSGISKSFQEGTTKQILFQDLSVDFPCETFSVIMGKSGSGKSTLSNIISGIDSPDKGNVFINSNNITRLKDHDQAHFRKKNIGFIFQFFNLLPVLTVLENITFIAEISGKKKDEYMDYAMELLRQTGLEKRADSMPDRLSGGEQQRVAICRALVNKPGLILADEPTGNLDETTGLEILNLLTTLIKKEKKTLIMVTHSQDALKFADALYTFKGNRLLQEKT